MSTIVLLLLVFVVLHVLRHAEYGLICSIFILGCGNFFDFFIPSYARFIAVAAIFVILYQKNKKVGKISKYFYIYCICVLVKECLCFLFSSFCDVASLSAAIYAYIIVFGIAYFSRPILFRAQVDFWEQYKYYILLCSVVQCYRAFVDYTFFGITPYLVQDAAYEQYYEFGESLYRPSSFSSPIVYSIELSVFFAIILFKKGLKKDGLPWLVLSFVGIMLTNSRSGMILIAMSMIYYLYKQKQYGAFIFISIGIGIFLSTYAMYVARIMTIFDFTDHTYLIRFGSIFSIIDEIANESIINQLIGVGYGAVDSVTPSGDVRFYTEDFYLGLIANSGFVALLAFIVYVTILMKKKSVVYYKFILVELLIINILAISLIMNVVQIIFWFITLSILNNEDIVPKYNLKRRVTHV